MGMHLLVLTLGWATGFSAYAFEKEGEYGYSDLPADISISTPTTPTVSPAPSPISQTPGSRVDQFERALNTLKIPLEPYPTELDSLSKTSTITLKDFEKVFKYIDGFGAVREYINIFPATKRNRPVIALYRDFYRPGISNKSYLDFATVLKTSGTSVDSTGLMARLDQISSQTRDTRNSPTARPLEGLKIAIDPGHMGGKEWDINTGKFVAPNGLEKGPKVSEGDLNLFTSMLLAQKLEALGAEVRLTHSKQQPVSPYRYDNYNETPFLYSYIYSALDTWMSPFLGTSDSEYVGQMRKNLDELTTRRNYRQEQFFVRGEDLQARIEIGRASCRERVSSPV